MPWGQVPRGKQSSSSCTAVESTPYIVHSAACLHAQLSCRWLRTALRAERQRGAFLRSALWGALQWWAEFQLCSHLTLQHSSWPAGKCCLPCAGWGDFLFVGLTGQPWKISLQTLSGLLCYSFCTGFSQAAYPSSYLSSVAFITQHSCILRRGGSKQTWGVKAACCCPAAVVCAQL